MLDRADHAEFVRAGTIRSAERDAFADEKIAEFDIRTPSRTTAAGRLSGGNQQKIVLARELSRELRLFVAAQPTRGIDVGSIEFVHKRIVATRDTGVPVIVVSTELDEVVALADRIAVMYRGAIVGIVPADTPRDVLGLMMAGELPEGTELAA
jgi:general nucleoside transport system ATP-binding protein